MALNAARNDFLGGGWHVHDVIEGLFLAEYLVKQLARIDGGFMASRIRAIREGVGVEAVGVVADFDVGRQYCQNALGDGSDVFAVTSRMG